MDKMFRISSLSIKKYISNSYLTNSGDIKAINYQLSQQLRYYSNNNNHNKTGRQSKILRNLIVGKNRTKHRWYNDSNSSSSSSSSGGGTALSDKPPKLQSASSLSNPARQGKNANRRVHVLNKLFMKHITDLMSTGEVSELILGHGVEISHVKITTDFKYINCFWCCHTNDTKKNQQIEQILHKAAGIIRHELSQLRLMGEVPKINFVKDKFYSKFAEVDGLLEIADFGDDYTPHHGVEIKQAFAPDLLLRQNNQSILDEIQLPPMRHDVFGLNQGEIMAKIRQSMTKTRHAWEQYEVRQLNGDMNAMDTKNQLAGGDNDTNTTTLSRFEEVSRLKDEEFHKFLEQRQHMKKNKGKGKKYPDFKEYKPIDLDSDSHLYSELRDYDDVDYLEDDSYDFEEKYQ